MSGGKEHVRDSRGSPKKGQGRVLPGRASRTCLKNPGKGNKAAEIFGFAPFFHGFSFSEVYNQSRPEFVRTEKAEKHALFRRIRTHIRKPRISRAEGPAGKPGQAARRIADNPEKKGAADDQTEKHKEKPRLRRKKAVPDMVCPKPWKTNCGMPWESMSC